MPRRIPPIPASSGRLVALVLACLALIPFSLRCTTTTQPIPELRASESLKSSGPGSARLAASAPQVGALPGQFTAGANGDAQYEVDIDEPPGIQGVQPQLKLSYGSLSGDGIVGIGWQLQGLSAISRCKQIPAVDGVRGSVDYDANDRYCLDGQRLINVTGTYGAASSVYRTELETWRQVVASQQLCGSGPCSFTVTTEQGQQWTYGTSTDSRILTVGRPDVRVWALTSVQDLNGNTLNVSYTQAPVTGASAADGQFYPLRIDYTANATASPAASANRSMRFTYASRSDVASRYIGGSPVITRALLSHVTSYVNDTPVKDYRLAYATGQSTGRSHVANAQVCAGTDPSAACLPATTFHWQDTASITFASQDPKLKVPSGYTSILPADVNGDGRGDLLYLSNEQPMKAWVYLASGSVFSACAQATSIPSASKQKLLPMDVNGDGRVDLVQLWDQGGALQVTTYLSSATTCGFQATQAPNPGTSSAYSQAFPTDVNGDGRTDLVLQFGTSGQVQFQALLSNGQGFTSANTTTLGVQAGALLWPLDVNADGQMDLVQSWLNAQGATQLSAYLSNGQGFGSGISSGFGSGRTGTLAVWPLDVNDDGLMDLVQGWVDGAKGTLQLQSFVSTGDGHFVDGGSTDTQRSGTDFQGFWPMDVNGDGRTDLVQSWNNAGRLDLIVYRNTGAGFDTGTDSGTDLSAASYATTYPLDFDGNGQVDLVQGWSNGSGLTFTNFIVQGPTPDLVDTLADGLGGQVAITYLPMSNPAVYQPNTSAQGLTYPSSDALAYAFVRAPAQMPFQVVGGGVMSLVSKTVMSNANLGAPSYAYTDSYQYARALIDRQGRGWLGFQQVNKLDQQDGQVIVTTYNQAFPYTGTPSRLETRCDATYSKDPLCPAGQTPTLLSASQTGYTAVTTATGATSPNPKVTLVEKTNLQVDEYAYGTYGRSRVTTYQYDAYGNLTLQSYLGATDIKGKDQSPSDNVYTCNAYANDAQHWRLGYLTDSKVSSTSACTNFTTFTNGTDLSLRHLAYTTDGRMNVASDGSWDSGNGVFLTTTYGYDSFGNQTQQTLPGNRVISTTYETAFNTYPDTKTFPPNQGGTALSERYGFEPRFGTQVAIQTTAGVTQLTCLDAFGRVQAQQGPPQGGAATNTNCLSSSVTGSGGSAMRSAQVATLKTQTWLTDSQGPYVEESTLQSWTASGGTPELRWNHVHMDGLGRSFKEVAQGDPSTGNTVACRVYDSDGRVVQDSVLQYFSGEGPSCAPGAGGPTLWSTSTYDVYGRLTRNVRPAGPQGTQSAVTTVAYSGVDTATVTYAAGDPYQYQKVFKYQYYNDQRKPYQVTVPSEGNALTTLAYDRLGRLTAMTDPKTASNANGVTNSITYDSLSRRLTVDNPDQNTTGSGTAKASVFAYGKTDGLLATVTDAKGQQTRYTYDGLGRVLTTTMADGSTITYGYDSASASFGKGQLTQVTGQSGGTTTFQYAFGYDAYGNRTSSAVTLPGEPSAYTTQRAYDPIARVRTLTYPDGTALTRTYALGNLTSLASGSTAFATFSGYTALSNPQQVAYGNGASAAYTYAPQGDLNTQGVLDSAKTPLMGQTLTWDHMARVTGIADTVKAGGTDFSQLFTYTNDRLTAAAAAGLYGSRTFAYDASGNLTNNNGVAYTYQAHRALKGTQSAATVFQVSYDANGNILSKQAQGLTWTFTYDARNQLSQVNQGGATALSSLLYDHNGQRLRKVDGSGVTSLYPDPAYTVTKFSNGTVLGTRYVNGQDGVIAAVTSVVSGSGTAPSGGGYPSPGTLYIHGDHLGSTALTTDATGKKSTQVAYLPYGGVYTPKTTGPDNFRPKFQGKEADEPAGLVYFGARYYDPALARFISPDTQTGSALYTRDSLNRFAFALNNPVTYTDPTGHSVWENIVGAVVGVLEITVGIAIDVVSDGALESVGGAFIGAGIAGIQYSATNTHGFSWKQYGIQQGIGAVTGLLTGGFGDEAELGVGTAESEASQLEASSAARTLSSTEEAGTEAEGGVLRTGTQESADGVGTSEADSLESENPPCPNSFVAGTLVSTARGLSPIEQLRAGDLVLSQDDATGDQGLRSLVATRAKLAPGLVEVVLTAPDGASETIRSTPSHPFWVHDRGWMEVGRLGPGDEVYSSEGTWLRIASVKALATPQVVYDLQVSELRTYFVGQLGAWVHNCRLRDAQQALRDERNADDTIFWNDRNEEWRPAGVAAYDAAPRSDLISVRASGPVPDNLNPDLEAIMEREFGEDSIGRTTACGNTVGACAEQRAASGLMNRGVPFDDVRFTEPIRPRTGRPMEVCENCERLFGRGRFPRGTRFTSDRY